MKKVMVVLAVALLAAACYQDSNPNVVGKTTPPPTSADGVAIPDDVATWTTDVCMVASGCVDLVVGPCEKAACVQGECKAVLVTPGTACTDAGLNLDECQQGRCLEGAEGALTCGVVPAENGTTCGGFYSACGTTGKCFDGDCLDPCDDGNVCTTDKCTEGGCIFSNDDGATCTDGSKCTTGDVCQDGMCVGEKVCDCVVDSDCDELEDGDPCNGTLTCKNNKCVVDKSTVVDCEPTGFEPCQTNLCHSDTGKCLPDTAEDGAECEDALDCTASTFCVEGECTGIGEITCEMDCTDELDEDSDDLTDCDDPDCYGIDPCGTPECGDGICQEAAEETCASCPDDCEECPPECGDGELQVDADEECDDGNNDGGDGCDAACKVEPAPADAGTLVVTEIMKNPSAVGDDAGEWFEVYNTTDDDIDVNAWYLKDAGSDKHRIFAMEGVVIAGKSSFVFGINGDDATNGGVVVDYVYTGFNLGNKEDEVMLVTGETVVDEVAYNKDPPWVDPVGASLSLSASKTDAVSNDDAVNWCEAQDVYGGGDKGTPGAMNPECPYCGDGTCDADEDCDSCADDCACEQGSQCVDGVCVGLKADGDDCGAGGECASGFCADAVCCDAACDLECQACNLDSAKGTCTNYDADTDVEDECASCMICGGGAACVAVGADLDPLDDCTEAAAETCQLDGNCDGQGACQFWGDDTVCKVQACVDGSLQTAHVCDGAGICDPGPSSSCGAYLCNAQGTECRTTCSNTSNCADGYFCGSQECQAKLGEGEACTAAEQCLSDECVASKCTAP